MGLKSPHPFEILLLAELRAPEHFSLSEWTTKWLLQFGLLGGELSWGTVRAHCELLGEAASWLGLMPPLGLWPQKSTSVTSGAQIVSSLVEVLDPLMWFLQCWVTEE